MDFKIIAVDFDGTLCENKWPEIGEPNTELIDYLKERHAAGDKMVLWTCRTGELLENAVEWSAEQGLIFDAVNENLPEVLEWMGGDTRKIFADDYIDDRNVQYPAKFSNEDILYLCDSRNCEKSCRAECRHTSNIEHAKSFRKDETGAYYIEKDYELSQYDCAELFGRLIDVVEDWMERKGAGTDDDIMISGADYDYLADQFAGALGISRDCTDDGEEKV